MQLGVDGNDDALAWEKAVLQLTSDSNSYALAWERTTRVGGSMEREAGGRRNKASIVVFDVAVWRSPSSSF